MNYFESLKIRRDILNVYKELFASPKNYEELRDLYIRYLKLDSRIESNRPTYFKYPNGFKYGNCYTYAMGLKCPKQFFECSKQFVKDMDFNVGFLSFGNYVFSNSEKVLLENFYADCEVLKIRVYNGEKLPIHGGYRIFMFADEKIAESGDFHFVRENKGGILSHKNGYNDEIEDLKSLNSVSSDYKLVRTLEIVR